MIKFNFSFNKDKETEWLNSKAQEGWAMTGFFGGFFTFEPCEKGAYVYQIDFTDKLFSISNSYREFMQEMGIEIIASWGFWVFLRRPASEGEFKLYTDIDSSIAHYAKIRKMFKAVTIVEIIGLFIVTLAAFDGSYYGYVFIPVMLALVIAAANMCYKTSDIIENLKERKTGIASKKKRNCLSAFLLGGYFLSCIALLISNPALILLKRGSQITAVIFMAVGIFKTMRCRKQ